MRSCPLRNIFTFCCPNNQRQSRPWAQQAWVPSFQKRSRYFRECFFFGFPVGTRALCSGLGSPPFAPAPTSLCLSVSPQPEEKNVFIFLSLSFKTSFRKLTNLRPSVHVFAPQLVNVSPSQLLLLLTELLCLLSLPIKQVVKTWYLSVLAATILTNPI